MKVTEESPANHAQRRRVPRTSTHTKDLVLVTTEYRVSAHTKINLKKIMLKTAMQEHPCKKYPCEKYTAKENLLEANPETAPTGLRVLGPRSARSEGKR